MPGVYPVVKPWDALVGLVSVASSLPLCVISGEELGFFRFHFLVASRICKATATLIKNDLVSVKELHINATVDIASSEPTTSVG